MQNNQGFFVIKQGVPARKVVLAFRDEFSFMSNFTRCAVTLPAEENFPAMEFDSTEKAYMAWKTKVFSVRQDIQSMTSGEAKAKAHEEGFPLREDYSDAGRVAIMLELNRQKYSERNPDLREQLRATCDAVLIEGNTWGDTFFGFSYDKGYGENHLGRILMQIRKEIGGM